MIKPELLAPAGDFTKMKAAIHYGADAVYLGDSRFSLRNRAGNFDYEELAKAVDYAHERNVKVYVTVNIFARNADMSAIKEYIGILNEIKPDAVIVSDPGVFMLFRKNAAGIDIHVSTQANVTNIEAVHFWESMGARRIILARELSIDEIRGISEKSSIELEAFAHGAVCVSYAGKCYLSSFMASRGANAGECAHSCRWRYALMEEKRPGLYFPVFEDERGAYIMNSRDLCLVDHLPELVEAGVSAFKIEGRMKGVHYAAGVTRVYRQALDLIQKRGEYKSRLEVWRKELARFGSRGYTTGMLFGDEQLFNFDGDSKVFGSDVIGGVIDVREGFAKLRLSSKISIGETVEYMTADIPGPQILIDSLRYDDGIEAVTAQTDEIVEIRAPQGVRIGDLVRKSPIV